MSRLIMALFVSNAFLVTLGLYLVSYYHLGATGWRSAVGMLLTSLVALAACLVLPSVGHEIVMLGVKILLCGSVCLTIVPLLGAISETDLDRLTSSIGGINP